MEIVHIFRNSHAYIVGNTYVCFRDMYVYVVGRTRKANEE